MKIDSSISAVVTGGASGLGQATAEALAAAGAKVAIFDVNTEKGEEVARAIGGLFCHVDITSEDSVVAGFAKARAAHGQERITVHCAMTSRRGKTLAFDKEAGGLKRLSTEDYIYGVQGILVASYRIASLSAEGMASLEPMEDGERGCITLTASVAAQDGQIGQVIYGSAKAGVNGLVLPMARDLSDVGIRKYWRAWPLRCRSPSGSASRKSLAAWRLNWRATPISTPSASALMARSAWPPAKERPT